LPEKTAGKWAKQLEQIKALRYGLCYDVVLLEITKEEREEGNDYESQKNTLAH
jgi:hypothetical protein